MALAVSYFAWVREKMGIADEVIDPPADVATVADLIGWLATRDERGALAFADPARIRAAIGGRMVGPEARLDGDVALFPPVTGG
ncbi:MAG: MoaD/ThiS family protein [Sphingopyxis sp.]|nr:MoaD/ThiS family protein [Sphingopyxis sp.]